MASLLVCSLICLLLYLPLAQLQNSTSHCNYSSLGYACGGLQIPYPFGMSDGCGLPQYRIACKRNPSYGDGDLPFLQIGTNRTPELQVLSFQQPNQLIVNSTHLKAMPSPQQSCGGDGTASLELRSGGPFILSDNNTFVVVGCNSSGAFTAVSMADPGNQINESATIVCNNSCYNEYVMPFCNSYACCINPFPPHSWKIDFEGSGIGNKLYPNVCGFSTVLDPYTYNVSEKEKGVFAAGQYGLAISWALQQPNGERNCSMISQRPDYECHANLSP